MQRRFAQMAEEQLTPFPVLKEPKHPLYETLLTISGGFESITACIDGLKDEEVFPQDTLRLYRLQMEELRAGLAHMLTGILHRRESVDWATFGQQATEIQERLKKPANG